MGCGSEESWIDSSDLQSVQTNFGVHQAFYSMSIRGSFLRNNAARAWSWTLTTDVMWSLPPLCIHGEYRDKFIFNLTSVFKCYSQQNVFVSQFKNIIIHWIHDVYNNALMLKCYKQWTVNDLKEETVQFLRYCRPEVAKELDQKL